MFFENFTEAERQQLIQYMLDNKPLENAVREVAVHNNLLKLIEVLVQNDKDNKGLILGIIPNVKELMGTYQIFDGNLSDI